MAAFRYCQHILGLIKKKNLLTTLTVYSTTRLTYQGKLKIKLPKSWKMQNLAYKVIKDWSRNIAQSQKKIVNMESHKYVARLLAFGSYILDLKSKDSDIDFVCVAPNFISRDVHFYSQLPLKLKQLQGLCELKTIKQATVPIITFYYKGLPIDISLAIVDTQMLPQDIKQNIPDDIVQSMKDKVSIKAILGRKNNQMILQAVGNNCENFKVVLRVIKIWGKNKGISSNKMGYLGGISWAIMVARIIQLFPNHDAPTLLQDFFTVFSKWDWKECPINITQSQAQDIKQGRMVVLTPAKPKENSTSRVNNSTFKAHQLIQNGNLQKYGWDILFTEVDIFTQYKLFIEVDIIGKSDQKEYKNWLSYVQSKLLVFVNYLQKQKQPVQITLFPSGFHKHIDTIYKYNTAYLIGIKLLDDKSPPEINLKPAVITFIKYLVKENMNTSNNNNVRIFGVQKDQLNDIVIRIQQQFKRKRSDISFQQEKLQDQPHKRLKQQFVKSYFN